MIKLFRDIIGLKRIWPYIRDRKALLVVSLILVPVIAGLQFLLPQVLRTAIDDGILAKDSQALLMGGLFYFILLILEYFVRVGQTLSSATIVHRMILRMRRSLVRHITNLSSRFHDKNKSGALATRATSDFDNLSESLNQGVLTAIVDISTLAGSIVGLFVLSKELALIVFALLPVVAVIVIQFSRILKRTMLAARTKIAALNAFAQEAIVGIQTVKILNAEEATKKKFSGMALGYRNAQMKSVIVDAFLFALLEGIAAVTVGVVLWFSVSNRDVNAALTIGVLVAFVQYIHNVFEPLKQLANKIAMLQGAFVALDRIFYLFDKNDFLKGDEKVESVKGDLEFRGVSFKYDYDSQIILSNVSFKMKAGESVAIVGRTGSGKSTILKLIAKLYDGYSGDIFLDGRQLNRLDGNALRKCIAVVSQDITLFKGSLAFNISLGDPTISEENIRNVADKVGIWPFIESLPGGLNYLVEEQGRNFSLGQRQLISFARALVKNPDLIILDEATASVDPKSEEFIQKGIDHIIKERTVLVVAHRLSTISSCDNILVLEGGRLIEQGSHEFLL